MKRRIAFLRGINISGKNKVDMAELKAAMEEQGFFNIRTFLNSENVSFDSEITDAKTALEALLSKKFGLKIPVYIIETEELADILTHAPAWWDAGIKGQYDDLIFILTEDTPEEIAHLLGAPTEGLERFEIFRNIIFWSFDRRQYPKCAWWKRTAAPGIAEKLTIRTSGTVKKVVK